MGIEPQLINTGIMNLSADAVTLNGGYLQEGLESEMNLNLGTVVVPCARLGSRGPEYCGSSKGLQPTLSSIALDGREGVDPLTDTVADPIRPRDW
jgi:hypothetical protein